ncbi:hypothetical protein J3R30DRAFT_3711439 [Lentinula aciculospora]|uniref:Uncharacterized protein n=1 Tax=Lentinula aciculospora TaxID=153920 RepID=A0A9W9DHA6_9AGAR|nr:hypothetical protein J3R30DRAFT_3711439 [Lentinula aciculospora]
MSTRSTTNTGKDSTPSQTKLSFQSKANSNPRPASTTYTERENEEFLALIEKAVTWKLMARDDDCNVVLPVKLLGLAAAAKETGRTRTALNDILDRIVLIAKILQEWSWKDKTGERTTDIMDTFEGELTERAGRIGERVDNIAREAHQTWKRLEEVANKVTDINTRIVTLNNSIPDRSHALNEVGEITTTTPGSYAHAAWTNLPTQLPYHPRHNPAVKEAEMKDRCIIITSQTPSDWTLTEKELATKANLALAKVDADEEAEADAVKPEVVAATKIINKGAFLLLRNVEEVKWIKQDDRME